MSLTPYNVPQRRPLNLAILELVREVTGRPSALNIAPVDDSGVTYPAPYTVIFPTKGGRYFGTPFHTPEADAVFPYIIHSIGTKDEQAEWTSERVVKAMVGRDDNGNFMHSLTASGLTVMNRWIAESPGPLDRDGKMFYVVDTFMVSVTTS